VALVAEAFDALDKWQVKRGPMNIETGQREVPNAEED